MKLKPEEQTGLNSPEQEGEYMNQEDNDMKKLDDGMLEEVSGGVIFNASGISGADPNRPWEVLNDHTGDNIYINGQKQTFSTRGEAEDVARKLGQNAMEVNWNQVCDMRNKH